jgi:polysaccharide biosynthesis protein PslF
VVIQMSSDGGAVSVENAARTYAVLSTYPPTPCGIATFSAALCGGLREGGHQVGVVRVGPAVTREVPGVIASIDDRDSLPSEWVIRALDQADVVVVQHEYGIYAGRDGASIVPLVESLTSPVIVVAHTILRAPTTHQRHVLEALARAADLVVVMTDAGRDNLLAGFDVDGDKVVVVPHGAAVAAIRQPAARTGHSILTWGLLGPGKGIEWMIEALALLDDMDPKVEYCIAGDTHPKVAATHGEAYRTSLARRAAEAGVERSVRFDAGYRDLPALAELIAASSVVVLPYDSPDQVTSGVLVDAVAAGRPVVATAFPHAVELLTSGAGIVVPRRDPAALAAAVRRVLTEPGLAGTMAEEARRLAPGLAWPAVAGRYAALGDRLIARDQAAV